MTSVMGIDPGIKGAIGVIKLTTGEIKFWLLRAIIERRTSSFEDIVKNHGVKHVYIEKAQSMPGQGVAGMFSYGVGYGRILGWCDMLRLKVTLVAQKTWTKEMHRGCTGKESKKKSKQAALQLFPGQDFRATPRCLTLHDGLIDAMLIAEFGRRLFKS